MAIKINSLNPKQLAALAEQIKRRQQSISQGSVQKLKRRIEALLKAAGLSLADVFGGAPAAAKPAKPAKAAGKARKARKGRKAKAAGAAKPAAAKKAAKRGRPKKAKAAAAPAAKGKPGRKSRKSRKGIKLGKVAPKYRNPANPQETWAGRGHKPRWFAAALAAGKKEKDMLI